jgi:hypothetical protein
MSGLSETIQDPVLDKIVTGIEQQLDPKMKIGYQQIVTAGMKVLFSDQTHQMVLQRLQKASGANGIPQAAVAGTIQLLGVLIKSAGKNFPYPAAIPAMTTLLCYVLSFAEQATGFKATPDLVAQAVRSLVQGILKTFKISPQQLAQGAEYNRTKKTGAAPAAPAGAASVAPPAPTMPAAPSVPGGV